MVIVVLWWRACTVYFSVRCRTSNETITMMKTNKSGPLAKLRNLRPSKRGDGARKVRQILNVTSSDYTTPGVPKACRPRRLLACRAPTPFEKRPRRIATSHHHDDETHETQPQATHETHAASTRSHTVPPRSKLNRIQRHTTQAALNLHMYVPQRTPHNTSSKAQHTTATNEPECDPARARRWPPRAPARGWGSPETSTETFPTVQRAKL